MRVFGAIILCWLFASGAHGACLSVLSAQLQQLTDVYGHGAVEDGEYQHLALSYMNHENGRIENRIVAAQNGVFEDTNSRVVDLNGDGCFEVVVVSSSFHDGARLNIYGLSQEAGQVSAVLMGHNKAIGMRNRWLAVAGVADFDGDGIKDIAYIDRPHLAKVLRIFRTIPAEQGKQTAGHSNDTAFSLEEMVSKAAYTNHHYGSPIIEGGVRACAGFLPVVVAADARWDHIVEMRYIRGELHERVVGKYKGPSSMQAFLSC